MMNDIERSLLIIRSMENGGIYEAEAIPASPLKNAADTAGAVVGAGELATGSAALLPKILSKLPGRLAVMPGEFLTAVSKYGTAGLKFLMKIGGWLEAGTLGIEASQKWNGAKSSEDYADAIVTGLVAIGYVFPMSMVGMGLLTVFKIIYDDRVNIVNAIQDYIRGKMGLSFTPEEVQLIKETLAELNKYKDSVPKANKVIADIKKYTGISI